MKQKYFFAFLVVLTIAINIYGIFNENFWLAESGKFLFFLPLIAYYYHRLPTGNFNFYAFLGLLIVGSFLGFFRDLEIFQYISLGLLMGCYVFLVREAIKHTAYEKGSRFMALYFLAVVAIYTYLLSLHVLELERSVSDVFLFSYYILYYLNILVLAVVALIYYLNSFSRKSVFFMCLTISFIFADVFRDMEVFYFPDLSVEIVGSLIRFAAIKLTFLFFVTPEKKLRLLNLV